MAVAHWGMVSFECGTIAVVVMGECLVRIFFESSKEKVIASLGRFAPKSEHSTHPLIQEGLKQLTEYFEGNRQEFNLKLDNDHLSPFSCKVQRALLSVPYGSVVTYGELAFMAGSPGAARAVGGVMSANCFPLIVPCHRVVPADGKVGQYSAADGSKTKVWLLDFERNTVKV